MLSVQDLEENYAVARELGRRRDGAALLLLKAGLPSDTNWRIYEQVDAEYAKGAQSLNRTTP